ncbi:MAG: GTPase Era [Aureispira sp.]|nr:GTPase Era [Aureispira sp.]
MSEEKKHKSGFINIIGRPNVGKSTLMNALVGERMSIITNKPQTTRHRIVGIVSGDDYQVVFSDTPGYITDPAYKMQEHMNSSVQSTFHDADIMALVVDVTEDYDPTNPLYAKLKQPKCPLFLLLNKMDLVRNEPLIKAIESWSKHFEFAEIFPISALKKKNTEALFNTFLKYLPEGPTYYPKEQFTDRPERFFMSEIIREKILQKYYQEIPYACEVVIDRFKEDEVKNLVRIAATIYVTRKSQKGILIGPDGVDIKEVGTLARKDMEIFLEKKVFLEIHVKVRDNWRNDEKQLKRFGYDNK